MALQKEVSLNNGLTLPEAFIRIEKVEGNEGLLQAYVAVYVNRKAYENGYHAIDRSVYPFPQSEESQDWMKQGYQYLLTRTEYKDALLL